MEVNDIAGNQCHRWVCCYLLGNPIVGSNLSLLNQTLFTGMFSSHSKLRNEYLINKQQNFSKSKSSAIPCQSDAASLFLENLVLSSRVLFTRRLLECFQTMFELIKSLLWRRDYARNVSQHTLYGVQHIHINLTLIHCKFELIKSQDRKERVYVLVFVVINRN